MPRDETRDLPFGLSGQRIVGRPQIGELGLPASGRYRHRREHRIGDRGSLKRAVAVPELVRDGAEELGVVTRDYLAVLRDIRDIDELIVLEAGGGAGRLA